MSLPLLHMELNLNVSFICNINIIYKYLGNVKTEHISRPTGRNCQTTWYMLFVLLIIGILLLKIKLRKICKECSIKWYKAYKRKGCTFLLLHMDQIKWWFYMQYIKCIRMEKIKCLLKKLKISKSLY